MKLGFTQGIRQYTLEFGTTMLAYFATLMIVVSTRPDGYSESDGRWLELLPAVPLIFAFWAIIRHYKRIDEYYQRLFSEAFALGGMILGLFFVVWGFAENAGAPKVPTIFFGPAMIGLWGLCIPIIRKRY
ncbi:MAG: hypothetical protein ABJG88_00110 [Litorimonas sp.]